MSKKKPNCSDDTYWDGEDCRTPDVDCGDGKRFKPEKGTCVTEEDPVCDDPDNTVLDKTLKKCVLKSGPDCPTGQRYNPATRSCVLLLGDCLEFEFCPVITSSVPAL